AHTEIRERAADCGEPHNRVERAGRRPHVPDADEAPGTLAAGDHDAVAPTTFVADLRVGEAVRDGERGHASGRDLLAARPELEPHRLRTGPTGPAGERMPNEARLEPFLEHLVARRLDAVDVHHRRREREGIAVDPLLLPVEH